jgi:uncharacterized RDD family membrane protein YckC
MFCSQCGRQNPEGARFCFQCGSFISDQRRADLAGSTAVAVATGERRSSLQRDTPQRPEVTYGTRYAGFWRRWAARMLDTVACVCIGIAAGVLTFAFRAAGVVTANSAAESLAMWSLILPTVWCYFAVAESSSMQSTLGKRTLNMVVTDKRGHRIGLGRATARWLLNILSALSLGIGYLMIAFMPKKQALHDVLAGTLVVVPK